MLRTVFWYIEVIGFGVLFEDGTWFLGGLVFCLLPPTDRRKTLFLSTLSMPTVISTHSRLCR
jgi:hypothetical protein